MKLYFVLNARMPSKKAYGIHAAKMCEAFARGGMAVTLVIPRTHASRTPLREFYALSVDIPSVRIWAPDWYDKGVFGFFVSSLFFMKFSFWYLATRQKGDSVIYTADMDTFSFAFLPLTGLPLFSELHDWRGDTLFTRFFFRRAQGVVATNPHTARMLQTTFRLPSSRLLVEPNGVDERWLTHTVPQDEARRALELPVNARIALYVGRFYGWKGLDVLAEAAKLAPEILWCVVGGSAEEFKKVVGRTTLPANLRVLGESAFDTVPTWLSAADVFLVLGTNKDRQSALHTSPLKVYEYLAAGRPIIASKTPSLSALIPHDLALWYAPDDAASLANTVRAAFTAQDSFPRERASALAREHTWSARAARVASFIALHS